MPRILPREYCSPISDAAFARAVVSIFSSCIHLNNPPWELFKHYWVVIALVLTTLSLAVLLLNMPSVSTLAGLARTADDATASQLGGDVLHPALGLLMLIVITALNVHKPAASPRTGNTSKPTN
jgi:hypothetical protein